MTSFWFIAEGTGVILIAVVGAVLLQFLLVAVKKTMGSLSSMFARMGLAAGVCVWAIWLSEAVDHGVVFHQPEVFEDGDRDNIFY